VSEPRRPRRWRRWLLAGVALLVVLVVAGAAIFVKSQPSAAPLTLPSAAARPPVGPVDGTWDVAAGSVAGFRIRESAPVMITILARRDGTTIEAAGSLPVASGRWGIALPAGFGFLGGLSSQATAEFLLILHRRE